MLSNAQTFTKQEAKQIVDGLFKIKYISKKGKKVLYQLIDEPNLSRERFLEIIDYQPFNKEFDYHQPPTFQLSRSGIIKLLFNFNFFKLFIIGEGLRLR
jgi:hypothetical protein